MHTSSETKYCSSYNCKHGYVLIHDADEVECKWGRCKEYQCCEPELVCSSYHCPKKYYAKSGSDDIKCHKSGCTTDYCCDRPHYCELALVIIALFVSFELPLSVQPVHDRHVQSKLAVCISVVVPQASPSRRFRHLGCYPSCVNQSSKIFDNTYYSSWAIVVDGVHEQGRRHSQRMGTLRPQNK